MRNASTDLKPVPPNCCGRSAGTRLWTDFALGAIDGMLEEIDRFQTARRLADYQAVFEQSEPLVSICVATADRADLLLERCISSLLAQTYRNLQIVVVGDHCTDDTEDRLARLRDSRISFMNLPERGPYPRAGRERWCVAGSNAMNAALAQCQGHFVTHLDDDDRYTSDRIERLVQVSLEQKAELCWHPFWAERDAGNWELAGDGRFSVNQVNPGAVFYHRYFSRFKWDPLAYRVDEPGTGTGSARLRCSGRECIFLRSRFCITIANASSPRSLQWKANVFLTNSEMGCFGANPRTLY